jgi:hypothetical protein
MSGFEKSNKSPNTKSGSKLKAKKFTGNKNHSVASKTNASSRTAKTHQQKKKAKAVAQVAENPAEMSKSKWKRMKRKQFKQRQLAEQSTNAADSSAVIKDETKSKKRYANTEDDDDDRSVKRARKSENATEAVAAHVAINDGADGAEQQTQ